MNNFQTILLSIFGAAAIFAVLVFSGTINIGTQDKSVVKGSIVIWGTFDNQETVEVFNKIANSVGGQDLTVSYIKKNKNTYQSDLVDAFARGKGPDLFVISPDMVMENNDFIYKIPYTSISEKTFKDTFIDGASIFLQDDGIAGLPLVVDPLMLFYNKNMFSNEGISTIPSYWDELFSLNGVLTKKEPNGSLSMNMISLGEYSNVNNAKAIISTLLLQSGNPIVSKNNKGSYVSTLMENPLSLNEDPADTSFKFYTEFSNPSLTGYSWNKSMPSSFDQFTSDNLAMYLGFASELFKIEKANPNLSFDVKEILQARGVKNKRTYGDMYIAAVNKNSKNLPATFSFVNALVTDENLDSLSKAVSLPPATRSLLSKKPKESYLESFFKGALISNSWMDPNYKNTDLIFKEVVENILSNKLSIGEAITKANNQINKQIKN